MKLLKINDTLAPIRLLRQVSAVTDAVLAEFLADERVLKQQAARAGDSLLYLAETMIALQDTNRACIALAEFSETYPALAAGRLLDQYEANRQKVTCN